MVYAIILILGLVTGALAFFTFRFFKQARDLRSRYARITDVEAELVVAGKGLEQTRQERREFQLENEKQRLKLSQEYEEGLAKYKELKTELSLLEENLEDISFGLYKPHFTFQTSDEYKAALEKLRDEERQMIRSGQAAVCPIRWTVRNSVKEGQRMVKLHEKLLLRAFNGECDAAIANVTWSNITKMEERIRKSFEVINKLGDVEKVSVTEGYLKLKLDEIRLTHEYEQKRYQKREEQRRIREEQREEEKARQEIERAREEAETQEAMFQKALEKARVEAAKATGAQLQKLTEQISSFESKLDEARKKKERAISRAEFTKSGFVYVISNIGSFGENIYKIGMTRRMDPHERVQELGGASVRFPFDTHAILYSTDAPELEAGLHQLFAERRLNLVIPRREFYSDVAIDEVEAFVKSKGLSAQFIKQPEAREYRETLAKREAQVSKAAPKQPEKFSESLFRAEGRT